MYTNEDTIKLFDSNNNFVSDFDKKIEEVEISLHGPNYYDLDEEIVDTNAIPIQKEVELPTMKKDKGISFKDFLPAIFMILIFAIVVYAGYYFLNNFDVSSIIHG